MKTSSLQHFPFLALSFLVLLFFFLPRPIYHVLSSASTTSTRQRGLIFAWRGSIPFIFHIYTYRSAWGTKGIPLERGFTRTQVEFEFLDTHFVLLYLICLV